MKARLLDEGTRNVLRAVVRALHRAGVPYAIGGAVAMAVHGFERYTADIDLFARTEERFPVFQALRKAGLVVEELVDPWLYAARLPGDAETRVDVLFPDDPLDRRAIGEPDRVSLEGIRGVRVFPATLLAAAKFRSDRPKDAADLEAMWRRGLFDSAAVAEVLASEDPAEARAFRKRVDAFVRRTRAGKKGRTRRPKGR